MWRRVYRLGRGMALGACAGLTLLAGAIWFGVAMNGVDPTPGANTSSIRWGGARGVRFYAGIMWIEGSAWWEKYVMIDVEDSEASETPDWDIWQFEVPTPWRPHDTVAEIVVGHTPSPWRAEEYRRYALFTGPLGVLMIAAGAWPLFVGMRLLGRQRRLNRWRRLGLCLACGYDLRGLESARCPECGAVRATSEAVRRTSVESS